MVDVSEMTIEEFAEFLQENIQEGGMSQSDIIHYLSEFKNN